jgi:hypothetical protein
MMNGIHLRDMERVLLPDEEFQPFLRWLSKWESILADALFIELGEVG